MSSSARWIAVPSLLAALVTYAACGGMQAPRPAGTPDDADCMMSAGAEVVCGYNCMMGSGGVVKCADTPDGECTRSFAGDVECTRMGQPEVASEPAPDTSPSEEAASTSANDSTSTTTESSEAYCCVNRAYYECPDAGAVAVCIGEPMQMMSCVQECPMMGAGGCEEGCIAEHGPDVQGSGCTRAPARDGECPAN